MSTKEVETFVGPCSKFVSGQGWTTEIPVKQLAAKGYFKIEKFVERLKAKGTISTQYDYNDYLEIDVDDIDEICKEIMEGKV